MESDLAGKFEAAAQKLRDEGKDHDPQPSNEQLLVFYGFFKQAKFGEQDESNAPGMLSMPATKAKWAEWGKHKGMSKDDAMKNYCEAIDKFFC